MEETHIFTIVALSLISYIFLFKLLIRKKVWNPPPGPPSLPIIGHLHLIKGPVHRVFEKLSFKYGPIMSLRFGNRPVLVITSPSATEECFTSNDIVLANRPHLFSGKYFDYNHTTINSAPYGGLWKDLRRITTLELLSTARLKTYMEVRHDEAKMLIKSLFQDVGKDFSRVEMRPRILGLPFNIITRTVADKRFYGKEVENLKEANKFMENIKNIFEVIGASNPGDFIPFLQWIDYGGFTKKLSGLFTETDSFIQLLIEERRRKLREEGNGNAKTFIDAMLSLQESEPDYYTDDIIKGNILTILLAGTDTSSGTTEWVMSVLLNHPDVLEKARAEIDEQIGHERLVQETDLPNLPYLQCIVNETQRLFTVAPLLVPHETSEDCTIGGFDISRGTMVLVNAWAMHRDPKLWGDDSEEFKPERFERQGNEGYKYLPFGTGRRQCPGYGLGTRMVTLPVASMIQCFEWKRVGEELVELSEGKGLSMPKDEPLVALCRSREKMSRVLMQL